MSMNNLEIPTKEVLEAQTIEINRAYINNLKQILEFIEELDKNPNKDRLAYANILYQLVNAMIGSIKGWQHWFHFNSMDNLFTLKEMEKLIPRIKKPIKELIEIDLEITEAKTKDVEKEHVETVAKSKAKKPSKAYVS